VLERPQNHGPLLGSYCLVIFPRKVLVLPSASRFRKPQLHSLFPLNTKGYIGTFCKVEGRSTSSSCTVLQCFVYSSESPGLRELFFNSYFWALAPVGLLLKDREKFDIMPLLEKFDDLLSSLLFSGVE
jgi:hypothetical protein